MQRTTIERRVVRRLCRHLADHGWRPVTVDDGRDLILATTETAVLTAVFAVDESTVIFSKSGAQHGVLIVLGNGEDVVADYSFARHDADGFDAVMTALD